jgi:hypothetical protein
MVRAISFDIIAVSPSMPYIDADAMRAVEKMNAYNFIVTPYGGF